MRNYRSRYANFARVVSIVYIAIFALIASDAGDAFSSWVIKLHPLLAAVIILATIGGPVGLLYRYLLVVTRPQDRGPAP